MRVRRYFDAAPGQVYRAFSEPELMQRWLAGPPGWQMTVCEMDMTVGGAYRWRWRSDADGAEFGFYGEMLEVDPPGKIAHTQTFDPGTMGGDMGEPAVITTRFEPDGSGTRMTVTIVYATAEDCQKAMATGMTDGMEMSYARLDTVLATPG